MVLLKIPDAGEMIECDNKSCPNIIVPRVLFEDYISSKGNMANVSPCTYQWIAGPWLAEKYV